MEDAGPKIAKSARRTSFTSVSECKQQVQEARRSPLEPEESHPNIVKRKSAISFESCAELDDVIEELSLMSPIQLPASLNSSITSLSNGRSEDNMRRGSVLQDILFSSIASLQDGGDLDWDSESDDED